MSQEIYDAMFELLVDLNAPDKKNLHPLRAIQEVRRINRMIDCNVGNHNLTPQEAGVLRTSSRRFYNIYFDQVNN